jgi:hypothetical protein
VSTEDWQDSVFSRARQLQQAMMLTAGHGAIVAEFFDTGKSRTLAWAQRPQAAALVAQDVGVPRGPAAPAVRLYLLAGLLACGRCGRRLESRPKNTYVREDQILPHLTAIAILLASDQAQSITAKVTTPTETAELIGQLRASGTVLTCDPDTQTIRTGGGAAVATILHARKQQAMGNYRVRGGT